MAEELPPKRDAFKVRSVTPDGEAHWLALRDKVLTSTDASALFGLSPYSTRFELYHHHKNGITIPFKGNSRVDAGSRMEAYAANEVGLKEGREVRPKKDFMICDDERVGPALTGKLWAMTDGSCLRSRRLISFATKTHGPKKRRRNMSNAKPSGRCLSAAMMFAT